MRHANAEKRALRQELTELSSLRRRPRPSHTFNLSQEPIAKSTSRNTQTPSLYQTPLQPELLQEQAPMPVATSRSLDKAQIRGCSSSGLQFLKRSVPLFVCFAGPFLQVLGLLKRSGIQEMKIYNPSTEIICPSVISLAFGGSPHGDFFPTPVGSNTLA